jgi:RNA polymerase sigma factor (sigma-70 family)
MTSDLERLEAWKRGDRAAGRELLDRYYEPLARFFRNKVGVDAPDLVQRTMLACIESRDRFRGTASFRTYLFTIARNELYRVLRTRQRKGTQVDFALSSIAELVSTPGTKMARNQEHRHLLEALRQLPVEQQTLLELHYWEDMEIAELAKIFDAPAATIRTRLHRARKALRERIEHAAPPQVLETLETMDTWAKGLATEIRGKGP